MTQMASAMFWKDYTSQIPQLDPPELLCSMYRSAAEIEQDEDLDRFFKVMTPVGFSAFNRSEGHIQHDQEASPKLRRRLEKMFQHFQRRDEAPKEETTDVEKGSGDTPYTPWSSDNEEQTFDENDEAGLDNAGLGDGECLADNEAPAAGEGYQQIDESGDAKNKDRKRMHAAQHLQEARWHIQREIQDRDNRYWSKKSRINYSREVARLNKAYERAVSQRSIPSTSGMQLKARYWSFLHGRYMPASRMSNETRYDEALRDQSPSSSLGGTQTSEQMQDGWDMWPAL